MKSKEYLKNLRLKSIKELETELNERQREIFETGLDFLQGKLKNVKKIGQLKRQVAQTLSVLREKEKNAGK